MEKPITELIKRRCSCRTFQDKPIDGDCQRLPSDFLASNRTGPLLVEGVVILKKNCEGPPCKREVRRLLPLAWRGRGRYGIGALDAGMSLPVIETVSDADPGGAPEE